MDELIDRGSRPVSRGRAARGASTSAPETPSTGGKSRKPPTGGEASDPKQRLEHLLAASPAIIYTTKAAGDFGCTFVSENLRAIMGYSPDEMTTDPKSWPEHLHPDDAARVLQSMGPLIAQGGGSIDYRFRHRDGHYIWIQDSFKVIKHAGGQPLELVGAWADITQSKRTEQSAALSNPAYRKLDRRHHRH